jgi:phage tail-like protein
MDANGTRYHLLLGRDDWLSPAGGQTLDPNLAWDATRLEVTLQPRLYHFAVAPGPAGLSLDGRRGAGRDRFGNWYWIGPNRDEILINDADSGTTTHFWSAADPGQCLPARTSAANANAFQALDPDPPLVALILGGLAVTEEHYLVVGTIEPAGFLVFDLHAGGPPVRASWPAGVAFVPFDMAPAPGGGVWILDRKNSRFWGLDRRFQVLTDNLPETVLAPGALDPFQPIDGSPARQIAPREFPSGVPINAGDPIAIEGLPDGSVLILSNPAQGTFAEVSRYASGKLAGPPASTDVMKKVIEDSVAPSFHLIGYDFAFVPAPAGSSGDRIDVVASDGAQSYAFVIAIDGGGNLTLDPVAEYLPMRRFGGKGLVNAAGQPYYDFGIGWVPLVAQRRPRFETSGTLVTRPFDGLQPGCVWHRLMLDAAIPPETAVQVSSRAGDSVQELAAAPWRPEPPPLLRGDGSELPYAGQAVSGSTGAGTWELLFQQAAGRYLQLRLDFEGNSRATPRVRALRAYYPRFSYLTRYLPAVYREDAPSASFLDRFLANVEGLFTALEDKIANVEALFTVLATPAADLDWLASWYGVAIDPNWDEARRRLFLTHMMDFFQYRGTARGLLMGLRLVLDPTADASIFTDTSTSCARTTAYRIVETYATRTLPAVVLGDPTAPSTVATGGRWQVSQGRAALNQMYAAFLGANAPPGGFTIQPPTAANLKTLWQQFATQALGFIPSATAADLGRWQGFVERRYHSLSAYNLAYGLTGPGAAASFGTIALPAALPPDGAPLLDWFQFEANVLGRLRTAHRFRVMLPAPATDVAAQTEHQRRYDLASRVLDLEKPAHTVYDVRFYWAYFQVGSARLGCDTLLDRGGRSPQLMTPMILGLGGLASSYLTPALPGERAPRWFLGEKGLDQ